MKKNVGIFLGLAALAVLIVAAALLYNKLGDEYKPDQLVTNAPSVTDEGDSDNSANLAPDFTVIDGEGNEVKLSDFRGKPVVLNFWASWCPPCKAEMPEFNEKYEELGDTVQFMMVNCTDGSSETLASAKKFIAGTDYTFPVFYDTKLDASMKYGTSSIPMTFFINAEGELVTYARGMLDMTSLERGIAMIVE